MLTILFNDKKLKTNLLKTNLLLNDSLLIKIFKEINCKEIVVIIYIFYYSERNKNVTKNYLIISLLSIS